MVDDCAEWPQGRGNLAAEPPGMVALKARLCDDLNSRTPERISGNRKAGTFLRWWPRSGATTSLSAYLPVSLTQIAVVPPSTTSSMPLT